MDRCQNQYQIYIFQDSKYNTMADYHTFDFSFV